MWTNHKNRKIGDDILYKGRKMIFVETYLFVKLSVNKVKKGE